MVKYVQLLAAALLLASCSQAPVARPSVIKDKKQSSGDGKADSRNPPSTEPSGDDSDKPDTGTKTPGIPTNPSDPSKPIDEPGTDIVTGLTGPGCIDWENLKNPSDLACAGSVENVFAKLPDWLNSSFTLMKKSRSTQSASQANPRVIVYDPTTNFVIAASSMPNETNVEVLIFDQVKEEWKFGAVDFSNPKAPVVDSQNCTTCHGTPFHVIWPSYPYWTGSVGIADNITGPFDQRTHQKLTTADAAFLNAAAAGKPEIPAIVRSLQFEDSYEAGTTHWNYRDKLQLQNESAQGLNFVISYKSSRSLANKLMSDPKVTRTHKLNIFKTVLCGIGGGSELAAFSATPYDPDIYMDHGLVIEKDFAVGNWNAIETEEYHTAFELFRRFWEVDAETKSKIPEAGALFQTDIYKYMINTSTADALKVRSSKKFSMHDGSIFVTDEVRKVFNAQSAACKVISAMK